MSGARVTSGQPPFRRLDDGARVLLESVSVDLGEYVEELHASTQYGATESPEGTTVVTVPAGFITDFSSIPSWAGWFMGPKSRYDFAGIVHDWLYRRGAPRGVSDDIWRHIARSGREHVGPVHGMVGWIALRAAGWWPYYDVGDRAVGWLRSLF